MSTYTRMVDGSNQAVVLDNPYRVLDVHGPDAFGYAQDFVDIDVAANVVPGWTCTLVNASTVTLGTESGGHLVLTTAGAEDDGVNAQLDGEAFELTSGQRMTYFGIRFQVSEATQSDILAGLCITDTDLLGGMTDGVYFECLDGGTAVSFVTEKDSTETQTDSLGDVADGTAVTWEFYFDGSKVYALIDGVQVAEHSANIPDDEALTPSVQFLTGAASAETMTIDWVRAYQVGR